MKILTKIKVASCVAADMVGLPFRMVKGETLGLNEILSWWKMAVFFKKHGQNVDLFRIYEYLYTYRKLREGNIPRWLDIGSGNTPFVTYVMATLKPEFAIINDPDPNELEAQNVLLSTAKIKEDHYLLNQDNYAESKEGHYPLKDIAACSIVSTIEHIPDGGDIKLMDRIVKGLVPGGKVVVTVPANIEFQENEFVRHYHGGFERRYNREHFFKRLQADGLEVSDTQYLTIADTFVARLIEKRFFVAGLFFQYWYDNREKLNPGKFTMLLINLLVLSRSKREDNKTLAILAEFRKKVS